MERHLMEHVLGVFISTLARNVIIFDIDNCSSSLTDNHKNNFLVLGDDINGSVGTAEEKFSINFTKSKTEFFLSLYYNGDNSS